MARDLKSLFESRKASARNTLSKSLTKVHLNFDLWTSSDNLAVISIFGRYTDQQIKTQGRLLAFHRQIGHHNGEDVTYTMEKVVRDWGIDEKIGVVVSDNATSNDTSLHALFGHLDAFMTNDDVNSPPPGVMIPAAAEASRKHSKEIGESDIYLLFERPAWELELKQNNLTP
ncbi:hypothetical protein DL767_010965 [Monosporascus sp. MG133]|nr:hypothetical protein DL767_010965 [Monosporascus sp. MG133]